MKRSIDSNTLWPQGFYASGMACGIKNSGLPDLALIVADRACSAAGVFTKSRTLGAPVVVSRRHVRGGSARAIVVNSGNANACTGQRGQLDALTMCSAVGEAVSRRGPKSMRSEVITPKDVLVASTGIIGQPLPMEKIAEGIEDLAGRLSDDSKSVKNVAKAILTTDLRNKVSHRKIELSGKPVRITGVAKGSGMIAPNMGTMLVFITTDAAIAPVALRQALKQAAQNSFNRISVDQHTSPSDMALVLASGAAGNPVLKDQHKELSVFQEALEAVCQDLAYQIVSDGEGATKIMRVLIKGASSEKQADKVGKAIVDSPLVKTAVHGADANWGRIVTAAGYSGAPIDTQKMSLFISSPSKQPICVFDKGRPAQLDQKQINHLASTMKKNEVIIEIGLGLGDVEVQWLGCDLSRQYITINADYTT